MNPVPRNLIISGGIYHPFNETSAALARIVAPQGICSDVEDDVDVALEILARGEHDLLTINALRWRMLNDDKYIPFRDEWQFELTIDQQSIIESFVAGGGGLLGLHTASICFDTWPTWPRLLGAGWRWGLSFHPEPGPLEIRPGPADHVITRGLASFSVIDELYHHLEVAPGALVLLESTAPEGDVQALMTAQSYGAGRCVYDALGHDALSLSETTHAQLLSRAAGWILGWDDDRVARL